MIIFPLKFQSGNFHHSERKFCRYSLRTFGAELADGGAGKEGNCSVYSVSRKCINICV